MTNKNKKFRVNFTFWKYMEARDMLHAIEKAKDFISSKEGKKIGLEDTTILALEHKELIRQRRDV